MEDINPLKLSNEQIGDVLQQAGTSLLYLGNFEKSSWILHEAVFDYNPSNVKALIDLGRTQILSWSGIGFEPSLSEFKRCVDLDPNNVKAVALTAGCLINLGESAEANRLINKAVTYFPDHKQYLLNCVKRFDSYYRHWPYVIQTDLKLYGAIHVPSYEIGESWTYRFFNSVVNSFVPTSADAHLKTDNTKSTATQLHVVFMVDTEEERQRAFQTARQVATCALTKLGRIFYYKDVLKSLAYFRLALDCDSQNVEAHCGRAKVYLHLKRDGIALLDITEGLQVDPTNSELLSIMETYKERFQKRSLATNTIPETSQKETSLHHRYISQDNNAVTS